MVVLMSFENGVWQQSETQKPISNSAEILGLIGSFLACLYPFADATMQENGVEASVGKKCCCHLATDSAFAINGNELAFGQSRLGFDGEVRITNVDVYGIADVFCRKFFIGASIKEYGLSVGNYLFKLIGIQYGKLIVHIVNVLRLSQLQKLQQLQ